MSETACLSRGARRGTRHGSGLTGCIRWRARSTARLRRRASSDVLAADRAISIARRLSGFRTMSSPCNRAASRRLTSWSSERTPPRPGKCFDRLKTEAAPKLPMGRRPTSVSIAWAASSINGISSRSHRDPSSTTRSGSPYVLPVKTAAMLDQVASVTASTRMFPSSVDTGAITGRSPAARAPKKTVSSSSGDMRMRSPGESSSRKARWMANRPDGMNTHSRSVRASSAASISRSSCRVAPPLFARALLVAARCVS